MEYPIKKFNYGQYKTLEEKAKWFSYFHHGVTLHMYQGKPYHEAHLAKVVSVAHSYIDLIEPEHRDEVLAACWAHDTIEDTRVNYNDVKEVLGEQVAELVYALTNEKGRNRKQRANGKYYSGIRNTPRATFVKLCDRIANVEASLYKPVYKSQNTGMFEVYQREHAEFYEQLHDSTRYDKMWIYLETMLSQVTELTVNGK